MCSKKHCILFFFLLALLTANYGWAQIPPKLTATGAQIYCPLFEKPIVTSFNIENPDNVQIKAVYIQISAGYVRNEDLLNISGTYPNITAQPFNILEGKIELRWTGAGNAVITEFISAVNNVVFRSSSNSPSGSRTFSITIGEANYLPSTGHYYEYVPATRITWKDAKIEAENKLYYGRQGYLATITTKEEAVLSGEQAGGQGWIGGSDDETEGVWKWVTGPEAGMVFWNGLSTGSSPSGVYSNWDSGEPNDYPNATITREENYAHIYQTGKWNDYPNFNDNIKGYIVEYGKPGDPPLNISTSTTISMAAIITKVGDSRCGVGTFNLSATGTAGATVLWFDTATSATPIYSGPNYTPTLSATTTYYVLASVDGCLTGQRTPVIATIYTIPTIISAPNITICEGNSGTLSATAFSATATINWYTTQTSGIPIETGSSFTTTPTNTITTYYVDATENGCTSPTRTEVTLEILGNTVSAASPIGLNNLTVVDDSNNNSITINVFPNISNYEFNLDRFDEFKDWTSFEHLEPGIHFLYLRDKTNCGISKLDIAILGFPEFFTPNGDGYNDTWKVLGNDLNSIQISAIYIFNRFGKLISEVDATGDGWDGFYNGEMLPASDYWYLVKYTDQYGDYREKRGNLSLIRR